MNNSDIARQTFVPIVLVRLNSFFAGAGQGQTQAFRVTDATVQDVHDAYKSHRLTAHQLVQSYLNRIEAYDKKGPSLNTIITINPRALQEADQLDAAFKTSGLTGPLHGIPVIIKDQMDAKGMPTTLGSILFRNYFPDRDSFVELKPARSLAKNSGIGRRRDPWFSFASLKIRMGLIELWVALLADLVRGISANFGTIAVGQEGFASIRRPATWNCVVGIRPTAGMISRSGVFDGWPEVNGSLGPITLSDRRGQADDVMVGYDPEDPLTAGGVEPLMFR